MSLTINIHTYEFGFCMPSYIEKCHNEFLYFSQLIDIADHKAYFLYETIFNVKPGKKISITPAKRGRFLVTEEVDHNTVIKKYGSNINSLLEYSKRLEKLLEDEKKQLINYVHTFFERQLKQIRSTLQNELNRLPTTEEYQKAYNNIDGWQKQFDEQMPAMFNEIYKKYTRPASYYNRPTRGKFVLHLHPSSTRGKRPVSKGSNSTLPSPRKCTM